MRPGSRAAPGPTIPRTARAPGPRPRTRGPRSRAGVRSPAASAARHLGQPLRAVREVVVQRAGRVRQQRAVAGQQHPQPGLVGQRPQPLAASRGSRRGCRRRRSPWCPRPEHGVAGQHRPVGGQQQADRVGGVPGRGHHPHLAAGRRQHVPGRQALRSPSRWAGSAASTGAPVSWPRSGRAPRSGPGARGSAGSCSTRWPGRGGHVADPAQVPLVVRPGVDDHGRRASRARRSARCWCRPASSGTGWGPSTQRARLVP